MNSEEDTVINWLVFIVLVLVGIIAIIATCNNIPRTGYFFVGGSEDGYAVMMDDSESDTTRITKWMSLDEAKKSCDNLNQILGDKANRRDH